MRTAFTCDLTVFSPPQRERLRALVQQVFAACGEAEELRDGFRLQFPAGGGHPSPALAIAEWITLERLCCPCITFAIEFASDRGPIAVRMTGEPGIKPFLLAEFGGRLAEKLPDAR